MNRSTTINFTVVSLTLQVDEVDEMQNESEHKKMINMENVFTMKETPNQTSARASTSCYLPNQNCFQQTSRHSTAMHMSELITRESFEQCWVTESMSLTTHTNMSGCVDCSMWSM